MDKMLEDFLKFETDENLFQRKYKEVYYWQAIRFSVANIVDEMCIQPIYVKRKRDRKWFDEKIQMCINAIYDVRNWHKLKKADILYFDQCSYRNISGKKVDPYFEYFEFEKIYSIQRCFFLNRDSGKKYAERGIGTAIAELENYFVTFLSKIAPFIFNDKEDEFIYDLCKRINSRFSVEVEPEQVIHRVKKAAICYHIYYKYYTKLLERIKPKAIYVVCHYLDNLWALYASAKEMKIPVIELEHGTVVNHVSYNYTDISDLGKQLPDYFFSYGEFWNDYISLPEGMKVCSIGNPFLENRYKCYADGEADDRKIVFYSDTWEQNGKKLMKLAVSLSNKYYSEGYRVFFKLHPSEYENWTEKYIELKEQTEIKVLTDNIEIYKLFSMAKHQVGVFSTTLYEAAVFDVNIYILNPEAEGMLEGAKPLLKAQRAHLIYDLNDLEKIMMSKNVPHKNFKMQIWKNNACENAQKIFSQIIAKEPNE